MRTIRNRRPRSVRRDITDPFAMHLAMGAAAVIPLDGQECEMCHLPIDGDGIADALFGFYVHLPARCAWVRSVFQAWRP